MTRNIMTKIFMTGLLCVALASPAALFAADISDGAGFFSAEAISKANESIRKIEKKPGHEIRIETFTTVPDGKADSVEKMSSTQRDTFFSNWLHERVEATKSHGVFILICKHPSHLRMWVGHPVERAGFGPTQAKQIRETLLSGFRSKDYDKALADTVAQLETTFDALKPVQAHSGNATGGVIHHDGNGALHHPGNRPIHQEAAPVARQSGFGGVLMVLAIVVGGVFLFSMLVRMFSRSSQGYGPQAGYGPPAGFGPQGPPPGMGYGYGPPAGGGGFGKSLAGGIFGAMAGNWLYDQFSGRSAHGGESNWHGSNSGGGAGGDSGGSDSSYSNDDGGTDYGGGDFGGDDSGGGGGSDGGGDF